jgi:N-methylhydantoinase B
VRQGRLVSERRSLAGRLSPEVSMLRTRLKSLARLMVVAIQRASRSPLKNQAYDFGVVIMDAEGKLLEADEFRALFPFAIHPGCRQVIEMFGGNIRPGDVVMHNDVFGGNLQLNDAGFYVPVFSGDELIAWTAAKGHMADLGGPIPSSCNPEATEYYAEGLRIPPVKVFDNGTFRKDVWNLIFSNVRLPEIDGPDMMGMIGACRLGGERVRAVAEALGVDRFRELVGHLYDMTETMMREEIRRIPDGTYRAERSLHYSSKPESRLTVRLELRVRGDELDIDFTGSSPQSPSYCNAPIGSALGGTMTYLSMLLDPEVPHNEGMFRPLNIVFPEGSILNPRPPAATYYGNFMGAVIAEVIMEAFSSAIPDRVTAGWTRPMSLQITAWDPRHARWYGDIDFIGLKGGSGALQGLDGWNNGPIFGVSTLTNDYEFFELQDPHVLVQHEFSADSSGSGRWRGGHGAITRWRFQGDTCTLVLQGEPEGGFGLFGGAAGTENRFALHFPDGTVHVADPKEIIRHVVSAGTLVERFSGGGGGFGDPLDRPAAAVAADARDELISVDKALTDYGVVLDLETLEVDQAATERERGGRRGSEGSATP